MCRETLAKLILERRHHLHSVGDMSADQSRLYTATHSILACARSAAVVAWSVRIRLENCKERFHPLAQIIPAKCLRHHRGRFDTV